MNDNLIERLSDEADKCRNDGADDIAKLLDEARAAIERQSVPATTGWVAKKDWYSVPVLFNPYTGEPRDARDIQSDPQGILIAVPGAHLLAAAPQPQPVQQEPAMYQFRWTNPAGQQVNDTAIEWTQVEPRWNGTVQEKCAEILAHRYGEKPCYEVRALYTSPQAAQPLTKTQRAEVCAKAESAMQRDPNLSWRDALMNETEQAHGITKGTT